MASQSKFHTAQGVASQPRGCVVCAGAGTDRLVRPLALGHQQTQHTLRLSVSYPGSGGRARMRAFKRSNQRSR